MEDETREGWGPTTGTKWHYFAGFRSLCGKYAWMGKGGLQQGNDSSTDNCLACQRKLAARAKAVK